MSNFREVKNFLKKNSHKKLFLKFLHSLFYSLFFINSFNFSLVINTSLGIS